MEGEDGASLVLQVRSKAGVAAPVPVRRKGSHGGSAKRAQPAVRNYNQRD
jgi:hypothetical protein